MIFLAIVLVFQTYLFYFHFILAKSSQINIQTTSTHKNTPMFFGKQITQHNPLPLSYSPYHTLQFNNIALSKHSQQAELYLMIRGQEILVCELNRSLNILHKSLNLLVDLIDSPALLVKNGNVHVCGYYQAVSPVHITAQETKAPAQITTTKKPYSLQSKFHKTQTLPPQTLSTAINVPHQNTPNQEDKNQPEIHLNFTPRQSSRLSSRKSTPSNPQPNKPSATLNDKKAQRSSKKDKKQTMKLGEEKSILPNGRYSLKALLQNIDNDDSDEESSVAFDDDDEEESSDDDDFDEDDSQDQEQQKKPKKKVKEGNDVEARNKKNSEQTKDAQTRQKAQNRAPIEVIEEQYSQKVEGNTEQFQQKWPQNSQDHQHAQNSLKQQRIQQLASKLKVPSIKPTI